MKRTITIGLVLVAFAAGGCKKKGGGGAWLVGEDGLMVNVGPDGELGGYDVGSDADLTGIACRGTEAAFVIGADGTFLRTYDAETWERVPAESATMRDIAVAWDLTYVASEDGLLVTRNDGDTWATVSRLPFASVSTTDTGELALMIDVGGYVWWWNGAGVTTEGALPDATAVALAHDGSYGAVVGGAGGMLVWDGTDGGWSTVDTGTDADLLAVWAGDDRDAIAVGADGTVVHVIDGVASVEQLGDAPLRAVRLLGEDGYAAGEGGAIYSTHDTGATWQRMPVDVPGTILDLDDIE